MVRLVQGDKTHGWFDRGRGSLRRQGHNDSSEAGTSHHNLAARPNSQNQNASGCNASKTGGKLLIWNLSLALPRLLIYPCVGFSTGTTSAYSAGNVSFTSIQADHPMVD